MDVIHVDPGDDAKLCDDETLGGDAMLLGSGDGSGESTLSGEIGSI